MSTLQTFVINLDRSADRLARISDRLERLGLPFTRVPAVDGRALSEAERAQSLDEATYQRRHGMTSLPGELGCYLSHVKALRAFLDSGAEAGLILEDDVQPEPELPLVLQAMLRHRERWDMVHLSGVHSGTPVKVLQLSHGYWLAVMLSRRAGSSAYVVNRKAAQRYVDRLLPMVLPYDHVYDQGWRFGLRLRMISPSPAVHDSAVATTIAPSPSGRSRKFHWSRRGSTYAYRLGNEWRRLCYSLGQLWQERRAWMTRRPAG